MSCNQRTVINRKRIIEALRALDACAPNAGIGPLLGLINGCTSIEDAQVIFDLAIQRAACWLVNNGSSAPFAPVEQLWDGVADVIVDPGTNLLRLTAPTGPFLTITLPPAAGYTGGQYVAIDLSANNGVPVGFTILPDGTDTIAGALGMVPVMGAAYVVFTPSGTGNWAYQITNNDDPRFVRMFSILGGFGNTAALPDILITPCSYNGNPTSWIGHDGSVGGFGGFMIPINVNDPVRCVDRFNGPQDQIIRHVLASNVSQPVAALGSGAGTIGAGAQIAIVGNDTTGNVRVTTGADATGVGEIWNLSFDFQYPGAPSIFIQSSDDDTRISDADSLYVPLSMATIADFHAVLPTGKIIPPSSTYEWRYFCQGGI